MMFHMKIRNGRAKDHRHHLALALLLVCTTPLTHPAIAAAPVAEIKRDSARCLAHGGVDACNDAIRWSPSDPALLVALGDAESRAGRPADALRHYRRAADLAPNTKGLSAKISATDARLHPKRQPASVHRAAAPASSVASDKQYSNAAPIAESH
jgi:hypothetical protein